MGWRRLGLHPRDGGGADMAPIGGGGLRCGRGGACVLGDRQGRTQGEAQDQADAKRGRERGQRGHGVSEGGRAPLAAVTGLAGAGAPRDTVARPWGPMKKALSALTETSCQPWKLSPGRSAWT